LRSSSCRSPDLVVARPFPSAFTTIAFDYSRRRWFGTCSCKPVPRGLPSSVKQLRTTQRFLLSCSWHTFVALPEPENHTPGLRVRRNLATGVSFGTGNSAENSKRKIWNRRLKLWRSDRHSFWPVRRYDSPPLRGTLAFTFLLMEGTGSTWLLASSVPRSYPLSSIR
jgi:hypothetical protein